MQIHIIRFDTNGKWVEEDEDSGECEIELKLAEGNYFYYLFLFSTNISNVINNKILNLNFFFISVRPDNSSNYNQ